MTASWDSLPKEIKLLIIPLIASSNVHEVAKTILALNHTNRFFRNFVRSEAGMLSILEQMPYTANAIDLITDSPCKHTAPILPSLMRHSLRKWIDNARTRLVKGEEFLTAIERENLPEVRSLLKDKNLNLNYNSCEAPLYSCDNAVELAITKKNSAMVTLLIKAGASPGMPDTYGRAPIVLASVNRDVEIARLLLAYGANPNSKNWEHRSALMYAVIENHREMIQLLLDAGADPDLKHKNEYTVHDLAKDMHVIRLLDAASAKNAQKQKSIARAGAASNP